MCPLSDRSFTSLQRWAYVEAVAQCTLLLSLPFFEITWGCHLSPLPCPRLYSKSPAKRPKTSAQSEQQHHKQARGLNDKATSRRSLSTTEQQAGTLSEPESRKQARALNHKATTRRAPSTKPPQGVCSHQQRSHQARGLLDQATAGRTLCNNATTRRAP